jgi:hypothetical protein
MSKRFQLLALLVMMLCSMMVVSLPSMTVHAQTSYPITKDGYEQWLRDNDKAKRNVKCPEYNENGQDKFTMSYCQCTSWVVFNLSQAGLSDDFISKKLMLKHAGTWASNSNVKANATFIDDATAKKWAPAITKWFERVNGGVASFKFFSFGPSTPLILEIVYKNGGGHVLIADGVTSGMLKLTDYNGSNPGDFDAFSLGLAINPPVVNSATGKVAWAGNVSWTGSGGKFFQMCERNSNFRNCLVNEAVSGNAYQAKSEAWARLQRGDYCARVGESNNGPWSDPVCFSIDNTERIEAAKLFRICIINTNHCLDVKDRVNKDKTIVQIWIFTRSGGTNQKWYMSPTDNGYYTIRTHPSFSNSCLDVSISKEHLQIYKCHYGDNQQFRFVKMGDGSYLIQARHSGKVLDIKGGVQSITKNGTVVQQYNGHGLQNQRWYFTSVTR